VMAVYANIYTDIRGPWVFFAVEVTVESRFSGLAGKAPHI